MTNLAGIFSLIKILNSPADFTILLYEKLKSILTHARDVWNVRNCNEDKPIVWLVCDNSLTSDPRTITELGLEPTG